MPNTLSTFLAGLVLIAAVVLLVGVLTAMPIMWLWNWLMPDIFGLTRIGFWQALGLYLLSACLIKPTTSSSSKD